MTDRDDLKADVFAYVADLSARTGVDLDPEKVWESLQERIVSYPGEQADD